MIYKPILSFVFVFFISPNTSATPFPSILSLSHTLTRDANTHNRFSSPLHDCYPRTTRDEMMVNDEWMRAAMADDTVVVELLLRLKDRVSAKSMALPFTWGLKQPRSRSRLTASVSRCDGAVSTRCSPTTPLSWSGGASPSATADGYEDSSRGKHHAARSKVLFPSASISLPISVWICVRLVSLSLPLR